MEEIKPVLAYVHEHYRSGDLVLIFPGAMPAFLYYQHSAGFDGANVIFCESAEPNSLRNDVERLPSGRRVWVAVSHLQQIGREEGFLLVCPLVVSLIGMRYSRLPIAT